MTLQAGGINTKHFTVHFARYATSSGSFLKELSIGDIAKQEGRKSSSSFWRFYSLVVVFM